MSIGTCRGNTYSNCPFSSQPYQFTKGYPKISKCIHPGRLTWNLKITYLKRKIIFHPPPLLCSMLIFGGVLLWIYWHSNPTIPETLGLWDTGNTYQGPFIARGETDIPYTPWVWDGNVEYNSLCIYIYIFFLCVWKILGGQTLVVKVIVIVWSMTLILVLKYIELSVAAVYTIYIYLEPQTSIY